MNISAALVKELREKTGVGMMTCKKALVECDGDIEKSIVYLREQGLAKSSKLAGRAANQGAVFSYIHQGSQLGVLVEIACETDFVSATDQFKELGKNLAMQIAASNPACISREEISEDVLNAEKEVIAAQARTEGKPDKIIERIVEGRIEKYYQEQCLLDMEYGRDDSKKVKDIITEVVATLGENIFVKRYARFKVGE